MKIVKVYESTHGSLHRNKEDAAIADVLDIIKTRDSEAFYDLGTVQCIIANRRLVIEILQAIDAPEH